MTEHQCVHEVDLARMVMAMEAISDNFKGVNGKLDKVVECIDGNGQPGLKTRIAVAENDTKRQWWWLGGISMGILGIAFFVIKAAVT